MQEYAERDGIRVRFVEGYGPAGHVRAAGSDFAAGALLVPAGTRLSPRAMIAAAAADVARVTVACQPKVAIIGTGDELAPPGSAHERPDAIPESVSFGIAAMVEAAGGHITRRLTAQDELDALVDAAGAALDASDLVIVTGGASVGERDFAKPMFEAHGLELIFNKVAIKPGKPVWLGRAAGKLVLGLPGNPTSAMVTATLFLKPILARMQGARIEAIQHWRKLPLGAQLRATGDRETFVRARWEDSGLVPVGNQDSGAQAALLAADWLIRCPAGQAEQPAGAWVYALDF
jgi:molybdopterin molybdotransferase